MTTPLITRMEEASDRRLSRPDWTVQRDVTRGAIRAALTTGEDK